MNFTVDASIAVKWFVSEPLSDDARRLLSHRLRLHAPDILLAEFANTIWKKARRGEIEDPQPCFDKLARLPVIVTLHPVDHLVERAAQLATAIDHPVYDCLYLACADATASALITADQRLARKIEGHEATTDVKHIGAPGVAEAITAAATALVVNREQIEALSDAYDVFAATSEHVQAALPSPGNLPTLLTPEKQQLIEESPAFKRLLDMVGALTDEERIDLLALGWLGAGRMGDDWLRSFEHASNMVSQLDQVYVASYGRHWRKGYEVVLRRRRA